MDANTLSNRSIGRSLGVSYVTVGRWRSEGLTVDQMRERAPSTRKRALMMRNGESARLAAELGVSRDTARAWLVAELSKSQMRARKRDIDAQRSAKSDGTSSAGIAATLGVSKGTVYEWRRRGYTITRMRREAVKLVGHRGTVRLAQSLGVTVSAVCGWKKLGLTVKQMRRRATRVVFGIRTPLRALRSLGVTVHPNNSSATIEAALVRALMPEVPGLPV